MIDPRPIAEALAEPDAGDAVLLLGVKQGYVCSECGRVIKYGETVFFDLNDVPSCLLCQPPVEFIVI